MQANTTMDHLNFAHARFDYEPYPICYIPDFLSPADYDALADTYPSLDSFNHKPTLGDKYSLAERNNADLYFRFLHDNPCWLEFYNRIKSKAFVDEVFTLLKNNYIDLGIGDFRLTRSTSGGWSDLLARAFTTNTLRTRFEFSIMSADGGHILPHTDAEAKLVTIVVSFIRGGEWQSEWGGGTDVLTTADPTSVFARENRRLPFDKMRVSRTLPFAPNQAVLFVKTYNSWHAVSPMHGPANAIRKTVTINIERLT